MNKFLSGLKALYAMINFDSLIMVSAIILVIAMTVIIYFKKDRYSWHKNAPSLITTLGIFCTFIGVTVGLIRFDPSDENSLNFLLGGLKLAFIPSALAIFISIIFKWVHSGNSSGNSGQEFLSLIATNTDSMNKLSSAVAVLDLQSSYRSDLEQNIEHNSQLLALLENSLINLITSLGSATERFSTSSESLEQVINNSKATLVKVNSELNSTVEKLNIKIKSVFESVQTQDKNMASLSDVYSQFDTFNQTIRELGVFSTDVSNQLKQSVHNEIREMETLISRSLKRVVSNALGEQKVSIN